jgi:hypothetical protein
MKARNCCQTMEMEPTSAKQLGDTEEMNED